MRRAATSLILLVLSSLGAQAATIAELSGKTVVVPYQHNWLFSNYGSPLAGVCTGEENFYFSTQGRLFIYRTNLNCNGSTRPAGPDDGGMVVTLRKGARDPNRIQGVAARTTVKTLGDETLEITAKARGRAGTGTSDVTFSLKLSVAGTCELKDYTKVVSKIPYVTNTYTYDLVGHGCTIVEGKR